MDDLTFLSHSIRMADMAALVALGFALLLLLKSVLDFSQTGPQLRREVLAHYRLYLVFSLGRLTLASFLLAFVLAVPGGVVYLLGLAMFGKPYSDALAFLAAALSLGSITVLQFCRVLHASPGVIVASSHYSMHRFYPLWQLLSEKRLRGVGRLFWGGYALWVALGLMSLFRSAADGAALTLILLHGAALSTGLLLVREREPSPVEAGPPGGRPNLLMIGSDTLRADRLGSTGYRRCLTPNLDRLAARGASLGQCYVPCARTAPSLLSLFTGTWPHTHGVRDNFVADGETRLTQPTLPGLLAAAGYRTAAVADWAGSDLGKFELGFRELDVPADQWNLKFFLRQGPKDIRLFLSLFVGNRIGRFFLEEIYYLAGVPLTRRIGLRARRLLGRLARGGQPFFLNVFMASTHPPFASEHPYYTLYSDHRYDGPSKFAMARLTDPFEILRRQGEPREEFDLDQILDLYDGCVKSFDDEVGRILEYLERSGLATNTLVVVYSDHGMEFFEHATWGQGNSAIGDFSARIPMILAGPPISGPIRLDTVSRTVDLVPTLLELLGLPAVGGLDGVSLAAALRGGPAPELPAFYETGIWLTQPPGMPESHLRYPNLLELLEVPDKRSGTLAIKPEYRQRVIVAKDRMVRLGRWKLVYQPLTEGQRLHLFDLQTDPACLHDRSAEHPQIREWLWGMLQEWMRADFPVGSTPGRNGTRV